MNQERLQAIINRIDADPTCWEQTRSGYVHNDSWLNGAYAIEGHAMRDAGKVGDPWELGKEWLELTTREANWLFDAFRKLPAIKYFCEYGTKPPKKP